MVISSHRLKDTFLTPQMRCYFQKKLPDLCPADLEIRIEEALKFLNIAEYCKGNIPVTQEIDDVWHLWILETREYARLCEMLQGRQFIDHMSNAYMDCNSDSVPSREDELEDQVAMLGAYVLNYGPFEADRVGYWKLATQLMDQFGWTLEELNEWLASAL